MRNHGGRRTRPPWSSSNNTVEFRNQGPRPRRNHLRNGALVLFLASGLAFWPKVPIGAQDEQPTATVIQQLFEQVFPGLVPLDPTLTAQVRKAPLGQRVYVDADGNGQPESVWFIDSDPRHPAELQPLLVCAIDEDGDLRKGFEPDLDSDLYIADWGADGTVDSVVDYTDFDGDQDLDAMAIYRYGGVPEDLGHAVLRAWWVKDVGDDNLLWHDVGYSYDPERGAHRSHFGGDEMFVAFRLAQDTKEWVSFSDSAFFYDPDNDGVSEEVVYFSGSGNKIRAVRHSFDADNDGTAVAPRDYDVSLTAWAPSAVPVVEEPGAPPALQSELRFDEDAGERTTLRDIATNAFLRFDSAAVFSRSTVWGRLLLTWDEIDHNVSPQDGADAAERWDGVVADGNEWFPAFGDASSGTLNKRYELVIAPSGPTRLYYHPTDGRVHLFGAERSWLEVDFDFDAKVDMIYHMTDSDDDDVIDVWELDVDADGITDESWSAVVDKPVLVDLDWASIHHQLKSYLSVSGVQMYRLSTVLRDAVAKLDPKGKTDAIAVMLENDFETAPIPVPLREKLVASVEAQRFFRQLLCDRLIHRLRTLYTVEVFWETFDAARSRGDTARQTQLLAQAFGVAPPPKQEPQAKAPPPQSVDWFMDWKSDRVGWESTEVAYDFSRGTFGFIGKTKAGLVLEKLGAGATQLEGTRRALLPESGPGCGGITLWVNGEPYPLYGKAFANSLTSERSVVQEAPDRVTVEILTRGAGPSHHPYTVRLRCTIESGRRDSLVEVIAGGGRPKDELALGIGLTRLKQEELLLDTSAGVLGSWGLQTPEIGRVGLGVLFAPTAFERFVNRPGEHQVVLRIRDAVALRYRIQCDWLAGRRFDRAPAATDWFGLLRTSARRR